MARNIFLLTRNEPDPHGQGKLIHGLKTDRGTRIYNRHTSMTNMVIVHQLTFPILGSGEVKRPYTAERRQLTGPVLGAGRRGWAMAHGLGVAAPGWSSTECSSTHTGWPAEMSLMCCYRSETLECFTELEIKLTPPV